MGTAGIGLTGVGSVDIVLASATPSGPGTHATSPESGAIRGSTAGVGSTGTVLVATSPFGRVSVGSVGVQTRCEGVVGRMSLALGTGPIDSSMSIAQFNVVFVAQSAGGGTYVDHAVNGWRMLSGGVKFGDTSTVRMSNITGFQRALKAAWRRSQ
jgi:hypothetical protein